MKGVCAACHSTSHVEGFYKQYDALVLLYNEKFAEPGTEADGVHQRAGLPEQARKARASPTS